MLSSYADSFANIVIEVLREVSSDFMNENAGWSTLKYPHNYWMDCNERKSDIHVLIRMNFNNFYSTQTNGHTGQLCKQLISTHIYMYC